MAFGQNAWFFCHVDCDFFPCHPTDNRENFNCLFCYCPLYALGELCGGDFFYTNQGIKNCSSCHLPHTPDSYQIIAEKLPLIINMVKRKDKL